MIYRESVKSEILAHLVTHPSAEDTLADWWVMQRCVERGVAEVRRALQELVNEGLVIRRATSGTYYVNGRKLPTIRKLLASKSRPADGREDAPGSWHW